MEPPPLPPVPPAPKKRSPWKIVLIVLGILVGFVLVCLGIWGFYELTARHEPVTERERGIVLTADYIQEWFHWEPAFEPDPGAETIARKRYFDGTYEVTYEYDHTDEDVPLYVYCVINVEKTALDAEALYAGASIGGSLGASLSDFEHERRDALFRWGSKSKCALVTYDGAPVGNAFMCITGTKVVDFYFVGVYFDEADVMREFLAPVLRRVDAYEP